MLVKGNECNDGPGRPGSRGAGRRPHATLPTPGRRSRLNIQAAKGSSGFEEQSNTSGGEERGYGRMLALPGGRQGPDDSIAGLRGFRAT